jgi:voltage-gated potassium channel Kch
MPSPRRQRVSDAGRRVAGAPGNVVERRMSKFLQAPPTIRTATSVIITAMVVVVVVGGVLFRVFDHHQYGNIWIGMWLAVETVTTVGYGDVTPTTVGGRIIAVVVMLQGISFVAIITAAVTSTFVTRAERELAEAEGDVVVTDEQGMYARFDEISERLDRLEKAVRALGKD